MENRSDDAPDYSGEERVKGHTFVISWDMTGLEAVVDVTQYLIDGEQREKDILFDRIKNPDEHHHNEPVSKLNQIIQMMTMRARANAQRHYEIYYLHTTTDITKDDLDRYFDDNPQSTAELIRERGTKLYSDRISKKVQVIT